MTEEEFNDSFGGSYEKYYEHELLSDMSVERKKELYEAEKQYYLGNLEKVTSKWMCDNTK